ncbi:MAG: outer membrane beta-barrel protein [Chitinophagaceae bacterium]
MKKKCIYQSLSVAVFGTAISKNIAAQTTIRHSEISIGSEYAIPVGSFSDGAEYGLGGSLKYTYHINERYGISLQSGVARYKYKGNFYDYSFLNDNSYNPEYEKDLSFTAIPIKLGGHLQYKNFFVEPQIGLTFFADNETSFQNGSTTLAIGIGYYILKNLRASVRYERWDKGGPDASFIGIGVAYAFWE